ncbi:hypothetical protein SAMN03080617_02726 [Algoriphagus alkaliphilus]|uniref:Uncharacterized protein n=1 Tax=Algoriphagus alkaliphilus TaxID=279824 RepID=A0A1G5YQN6_9BACT|nr:hypothetical protein [Algoriphagus alkaliphilus]SDA84580.1 hypothetical protein SAMN03080617_02726 [Algoriphagus alkaliphilus]
MILLKIFFVSLILIEVSETNTRGTNEYDLINFLACETNEYVLVDERFLFWKDYGSDSYAKLPTKNIDSGKRMDSFDLDSPLEENDRGKIEQVLNFSGPHSIHLDSLNCESKLNKTKDLVPKKTIYSYSCPILLKGIDHQLYGIILEQETFEINNELKLKVFVKRSDSWGLVYESLIALS